MAAFVFTPPATIEAGWLACRRWQEADASALLESVRASAEHLAPWMPWAAGYDLASAKNFVAGHAPGNRTGEDAAYAICNRTGRILGGCGLHARLGSGALEIGYWVDVRHTRRGVATLAAAGLTEAAFTLPSVRRVEIHHDQANVLSGRIPAALGFAPIAAAVDDVTAPGEAGVECRWRLRQEQFPGSPAAALLGQARPVNANIDARASR